MPYKIQENDDDTFDVVKVGSDKPLNKKPYTSRDRALAYQRALEANAPDEKKSLNLSYVKSLGLDFSADKLAVKYVARDEIRHPVFLWGDKSAFDLEREYFRPDTNFWDDVLKNSPRPLTWNHAQDGDFKASPIVGQTVEWEDDEVARWAISKLDRHHRYRKAIDALIEEGALGASSDSAPQYVQREQTGKSTWLKVWPWFATALTDVPCEPRMIGSIETLKSYGIEIPMATDTRARYEYQKAQAQFLAILNRNK